MRHEKTRGHTTTTAAAGDGVTPDRLPEPRGLRIDTSVPREINPRGGLRARNDDHPPQPAVSDNARPDRLKRSVKPTNRLREANRQRVAGSRIAASSTDGDPIPDSKLQKCRGTRLSCINVVLRIWAELVTTTTTPTSPLNTPSELAKKPLGLAEVGFCRCCTRTWRPPGEGS